MSRVDDPREREIPLFLRTDLFPEPDVNGMVTFKVVAAHLDKVGRDLAKHLLGGDHRDEIP